MGLPAEEVQRQWAEVYARPYDEWQVTPEDSLYWMLVLPALRDEAIQRARAADPDWATRPARTDGRTPIPVDIYP